MHLRSAFAALVLGKAYGVARAALVPALPDRVTRGL